jgi:hypothetical protein
MNQFQGCYPESTERWPSDNHQGNNPSIVNSVTNDEDEDAYPWSSVARKQSHGLPPHRSSTRPSRSHSAEGPRVTKRSISPIPKSVGSSSALNVVETYLIGYERMVMEQDREKMVTCSHLQPILELLDTLSQEGNGSPRTCTGKVSNHRHPRKYMENHFTHEYTENGPLVVNTSNVLSKEFSYENLKWALSIIEDEASTSDYDVIKTDEQFMLVLRLLCEAPLNSIHAPLNSILQLPRNTKISWAEILQCYRLCIVGMQTLESLSTPSLIRTRAKERTLRILSMFQPASDHFVDSSRQSLLLASKCQPETSTWPVDKLSHTNNFADSHDVFKRNRRSTRQGWNASVKSFTTAAMLVCIAVLGMWHIINPVETVGETVGSTPFISPTAEMRVPSVCQGFSHDVISLPRLERISKNMEKPAITQTAPERNQSQSLPRSSHVRRISKVTSATTWSMPSVKSHSSIPSAVRPTHAGNSNLSVLDSTPLSARMGRFEDIVKETDEDIHEGKQMQFLSSPELGAAAIVGGTTTVLFFLLPIISGGAATVILNWIPSGLTVMFATMFGSDIREWVSRWSKLLPWRKGSNPMRRKRGTSELTF